MEKDTVDKGWLSGVYWKTKYDDLLVDYQELVHKYEELKREVDHRYRNKSKARPYLLGGDKEP